MKKVENVPKILIALTYTEEFKRNINIIKKLHKIRFFFFFLMTKVEHIPKFLIMKS